MILTIDDIKILSEPFDEKTIGIKVQSLSRDKTKAMLVCYLQHTDVYARLEKVDPCWTADVTNESWVGESCFVRVKLTLKGVSRENSGEGNDPKSATSDAIKRAAMLFGVGRYLYDSETVWIPYNENTDKFKSYTYDDYRSYLRKPTAPTAQPKPALAPSAGPSVGPRIGIVQNNTGPSAAPQTKDQVGAAIMRAARNLNLSSEEMANWTFELYKKQISAMTVGEMNNFLGILEWEIGKLGVPAT